MFTRIKVHLKTLKDYFMMKLTLAEGYLTPNNLFLLLGTAPTGKGTIALDPTFGSFTLLEPVSHWVKKH